MTSANIVSHKKSSEPPVSSSASCTELCYFIMQVCTLLVLNPTFIPASIIGLSSSPGC